MKPSFSRQDRSVRERIWSKMIRRARRATLQASMRLVLLGSIAITVALAACARRPTVDGRCGVPVAHEQLWAERSPNQVDQDIEHALACGRANGRRVLLEFVATWCADCVRMTEIDQTAEVRDVIRARYEHVRINVTQWNEHAALRERFGVNSIAAYLVLDPANGRTIARTTLEPVTAGTVVTPASWARWLRDPRTQQ